MITLRPITSETALLEYHRFRYHIYSESRQKGFLVDKEHGLDIDQYDARARHYGWYLGGELVGCVRFVEPDESEDALPMLRYMDAQAPKQAVRQFIAERSRRGERMVEASRFCLAPEHRGLRVAKEFVLAMVRTMQPLGFEHGLFDCDERHGAFYRLLGFDTMPVPQRFQLAGCDYAACVQQYDFSKVLARNPGLMKGLIINHERQAA